MNVGNDFTNNVSDITFWDDGNALILTTIYSTNCSTNAYNIKINLVLTPHNNIIKYPYLVIILVDRLRSESFFV